MKIRRVEFKGNYRRWFFFRVTRHCIVVLCHLGDRSSFRCSQTMKRVDDLKQIMSLSCIFFSHSRWAPRNVDVDILLKKTFAHFSLTVKTLRAIINISVFCRLFTFSRVDAMSSIWSTRCVRPCPGQKLWAHVLRVSGWPLPIWNPNCGLHKIITQSGYGLTTLLSCPANSVQGTISGNFVKSNCVEPG